MARMVVVAVVLLFASDACKSERRLEYHLRGGFAGMDRRLTISTDGGAELDIGNSNSWPGHTRTRPPGTFRGRVPGAQLDALWSYIREHDLLEHGYLDRERADDGIIETLKLVDGWRTAEYRVVTEGRSDPAFSGLVKRLDELALALASQSP